MTNYPKTKAEYDCMNEDGFNIISSDKNEKVINFVYVLYDEGHPNIKDNIYREFKITFYQIFLNYFHKPIFRIYNFIMK